MSAQMKIFCKNINRYIDFTGGETLAEILRRIEGEIPFEPICARVNNKTEALQYAVFAPKQVEYLPVSSASGTRVYVRSLCMMLYRALVECYPGVRLNICHSISRGYYCRLDNVEVTDEVVETLRAAMQRLVERDIPFERKERLTADVREMFRAEGLDDKVRLLDTIHDLYTVYYRLDGVIDTYYGSLAPSTGRLRCFDLKRYHDGFLLLGVDPSRPDVPAQPVTQEKMYQAFKEYVEFNNIIGVRNVGELNVSTEANRSAELINVAEALHDKKIAAIADEIKRRYDLGGARVVMIAGPSSSGKTTFTKRLAIYLLTNLLRPKMISLDNYFVDRVNTPLDETGDYDYESLYALDLHQFNTDLRRLIAGEEVEMPTYNFELGCRQYKGDTLKLDDRSILLIEGIHGLNPELTSEIDDSMKYRIYVSALTTLAIDDHNWVPTTDNRLLRRIIRDHKYRGASALATIRRWPSVRRGEERWIFPYQENADSTFNSSLIFELGVMREYGEAILKNFPRDVEEYAEAHRLMKFLSYFLPIPGRDVPPTSLLREFLGGSSFHY
ncbi:MAG: nucleoside kinase [Barnesiella sp.]|nr:nucleoside kinase [Barnesiella sp.]MBD5247778.1 nucleoside kinase [Barnesiella sp.]MBD5257801.1 nucleoside kinase [Barnesiella sp.]